MPAGFATGLAVNASSIYWSSGGTLNQMPLAGGASVDLVDGQNDAFGVALDDTNVYWTTLYGGVVQKMPLGGGAVTTLVSGLSAYASGIAVDDTSIYWAATTASEVGSIMRLAK
jgi:DNA-binding beta-propeller fold protein YncE